MFNCEKCNYICSRSCDLTQHLTTRKHIKAQNANLVPQDNKPPLKCITCHFECSKQCDMVRHLQTRKHMRLIEANKKEPVVSLENVFKCECGNEYKHMSSLCKHKRTCSTLLKNADVLENSPTLAGFPIGQSTDTQLLTELIKQNQEFKQIIIQQNEKMMEVASRPTVTNNNNNNTQHNHFNLQLFLNEQCKDAMNLSEFLENLVIDNDDIHYMGEFGYVDGMTNIIVKRFGETDIYKRPIHCTDLKREVMYIKNDDKWTKESSERSNLKHIVNTTFRKNRNKVDQWAIANPEITGDMKNPQFDYYVKLMRASLGGHCHEQDLIFANKIIHNLAKKVFVDKSNREPTTGFAQ